LPVNRSRPIAARTDAENGYLDRADNRGQVILPTNITERFMIREQLHNGRLTVFFQPVEDKAKVGEIYIFSMGLKDPAMPDALEVEVRVRMVEEVQQPKPKPKVKKEPKGGSGVDNKGSGEKAPTHGLPPWGLLAKVGTS